MKNQKQVVIAAIVFLAVSASLSAFRASAANVNKTGWPIVNEKTTVEMMGSRAPNQADWNTLRLWEWYEGKTNMHVNWTTVDHDAREERKPLLFASGDYPEVFYGMYLSPQEEIKYGSQGILLPLEDLFAEYAPNTWAYLNSDPAIKKTYTAPDGHIYTFPSGTDRTVFLNAYTMINTHWLDALGLKMPATVDDFYQVLQAFKTKDPNGNGQADEIPLCLDLKGSTFWQLLQWFGITADGKNRVYAEDDGKIIYVPTDARTLEALKWWNKLWQEGLVDQEAFTQSWREIDAKGQAKEAELLGAFMRSTIAWTVGFERFDHYEIMPALQNHLGTKVVTGTNVESKGRFSLTNKVKHPEAIIRWIDYFATVEGAINIQFGPEGEKWKWVDEARTKWVRIESDVQSTAESVTPKNGTFVPFINFDWIVRNRALKEGEIDWQAKVYAGIDEHLHPYRRVAFPDAYMSIEQVNAVSAIQTDLNAYVDQMIARFIVGDEPLSNWDAYVKTINRMGVDRLLAVYQDVYDAYNK